MKKFFWGMLPVAVMLQAGEPVKGVEGLSGDIRGLLSQEMLQIEKGMHSIFSNMVRGDYDPIVKTATQIQDSFIFKRKLTPAQRKELKGALPKAFIALDRSFHETAGELAAAAEFGDKEAVLESYTAMAGKCVQCHSTYAVHRFTGFSE